MSKEKFDGEEEPEKGKRRKKENPREKARAGGFDMEAFQALAKRLEEAAETDPNAVSSPENLDAANAAVDSRAQEVLSEADAAVESLKKDAPPAGEVPPAAQHALDENENAARGAATELENNVAKAIAEPIGTALYVTSEKRGGEDVEIKRRINVLGVDERGDYIVEAVGKDADKLDEKRITIDKSYIKGFRESERERPVAAEIPVATPSAPEVAAAEPAKQPEAAAAKVAEEKKEEEGAESQPIGQVIYKGNKTGIYARRDSDNAVQIKANVAGPKASKPNWKMIWIQPGFYEETGQPKTKIKPPIVERVTREKQFKGAGGRDFEQLMKAAEAGNLPEGLRSSEGSEVAAAEPAIETSVMAAAEKATKPEAEKPEKPAAAEDYLFDFAPTEEEQAARFESRAPEHIPESVFSRPDALKAAALEEALSARRQREAETLEAMNRPAAEMPVEAVPAEEGLPARETVDVEYRRYTTRENILKRFISHKFERLANWTDRVTGYKSGDWGNAQYDLIGRSIVRVKNFFTGKLFDSRNKSVMKAESKLGDLRDKVTEQEAENEINREIRDNPQNSYQDRKRAAKEYNSGAKKLNSLKYKQARHLSKVGKLESMKEACLNGINERSLRVSRDIEERVRPMRDKLEQAKLVLTQAERARDEAAAERAGWQAKLDNLKIRLMSVPKNQQVLVKQAIKSCDKILTVFDKKYNEAEIGLAACQEHIGHLESLINPWQDMSTMYQEITDKQVYVSDEEKPSYEPVSSRINAGQGRRFEATESLFGDNQRINAGKYLKEVNDNLGFGAPEFTAAEIAAILGADVGADTERPLADLESRIKPVLIARRLSERQAEDILNLTRATYRP